MAVTLKGITSSQYRHIGRHQKSVYFGGFTSLTGGSLDFFRIEKDASPELYALADAYPKLLSRAVRHLAWRVLLELKQTIRQGGPEGAKWPERSLMHKFRRLEMWFQGNADSWKNLRLKRRMSRLSKRALRRSGSPQGDFPLLSMADRRDYRHYSRRGVLHDEQQSIPDAFMRWQTPNRTHGKNVRLRNPIAMSGYIYSNLVYNDVTPLHYEIGALTPTLSYLLEKVQRGQTKRISPRMRRSFWAAGIPLNKGKTSIEMPPRPLIEPVFRKMRPQFEKILIDRIRGYLDGTTKYV